MNAITTAILAALITAVLSSLVFVALVPWIRLQRLRSQAKQMIPKPGQLWRQENDLLYVVEITNTGLKFMRVDAKTGQVTEFYDSWVEWQERISNRVVWYTGTQRTLV